MIDAPTKLDKSFHAVLESMVGKEFTVINPESFEETGMGHSVKLDWYPAKIAAIGDDFVVLVLRFKHGSGKHASSEPVEQYIPLARIKRLSRLKGKRYIHL